MWPKISHLTWRGYHTVQGVSNHSHPQKTASAASVQPKIDARDPLELSDKFFGICDLYQVAEVLAA